MSDNKLSGRIGNFKARKDSDAWKIALNSICRTPEDAKALLPDLLSSTDENQIIAGMEITRICRADEYLEKILEAGCSDHIGAVTQAAFKTIKERATEEFLPKLIEKLDVQNTTVNYYLINTIGWIKNEESTVALAKELRRSLNGKAAAYQLQLRQWVPTDPIDKAYYAAYFYDIETLNSLGKSAVPVVCHVIRQGLESEVLVNFLGQYDDPEIIDTLAKRFMKYEVTRDFGTAAEKVLASYKNKATPVLIEMLTSDERLAHYFASKILAKTKDPTAEEALFNLLQRNKEIAYRYAFEALGFMKSRRSVPLISKWLNHSDLVVQKVCINALARIGDPSVLPQLYDMRVKISEKNVKHLAAAITKLEKQAK